MVKSENKTPIFSESLPQIQKQRIFGKQEKQTNKQPQITQPGLATSMKTLVENYQKGIPLGVGQRVPVYGKAGNAFKRYDLVEIQKMKIETEAKIEKLEAEKAEQERHIAEVKAIKDKEQAKEQLKKEIESETPKGH